MRKSLKEIVGCIGRCYPFYRGYGFFSNSSLFMRVLKNKNKTLWTKLNNGYKILVYPDLIGRQLLLFGDFDPEINYTCRKLVDPGDTVVDIGANIGLVTLFLSQLVGDQGRVHSFEPQKDLVKMLELSIDSNQLKNINIHNFALGTKNEHLDLFIPKDNLGGACLVQVNESDNNLNNLVEVRNSTETFNDLDLKKNKINQDRC